MTDTSLPAARTYRRRSLISALSMVILRPVQFFRELPAPASTRQWFFMGLILLALAAFSSGYINPVKPTTTQEQWAAVLLTLTQVLAMWLGLAIVLSLVSLFNGARPRLAHNLQIAIWSSVPLGIMALLQVIYVASGGAINSRGISRVIYELESYATWTPTAQQFALSLAMHLHIFALWHLALIFVAARQALNGRTLAVIIVLIIWVLIMVIMPIALGMVQPPAEPVLPDSSGEGMFPPNGEFPPEGFPGEGGEMSGEMGGDFGGGAIMIEPAMP